MAQMLGLALEIAVKAANDGTPNSLTLNHNRHKVVRIYDHWRIGDSWWADEVRRDYFKVELNNGSVSNIYHDMVANRWYLAKSYG
jgi:hypothetical protein